MYRNKSLSLAHVKWAFSASVVSGCVLLAAPVHAAQFAVEPHWAGVQIGRSTLDVDGADLDAAGYYSLEVGRWFTANFGVEMGLSALRDSREDGEDNRGSYTVKLDASETYVGPRVSTSHFNAWRFFGSAGLLYSQVDIEVEEEFFGLKPAGKTSDSNNALGYYLGGGVSYAPPGRLDYTAVARYRHRPGVIEAYSGDTDINDASISLGLAFRF